MGINFTHPWPFIATAAFVAGLGFYAWQQPGRPGARYFSWMVAVWIVWALAAGVATSVQTPALHYSIWAVQTICALLTSLVGLFFALDYTGNGDLLAQKRIVLLVLPVLTFASLAVFLPSRALVSIEVRSGIPAIQVNDMAMWAPFLVNSVIWLISLAIYIRCLVGAPMFYAPILWILAGQILPPIAYFALDPQQSGMPPMQSAILVSNFTALTLFIALYHYHILQVTPAAFDPMMKHMPYGFFVLDTANRLVDFNRAAQALPRTPPRMKMRQPAAQALGEWWEPVAGMIGPKNVSQTIIFNSNAKQEHFRVHSSPLLQPSGWRCGQVFVIEDITQIRQEQRRQAQTMWTQATLQEREQLARELHDGLSQSLAFLNLQSQTVQQYLDCGQHEAAQVSLSRLTKAADQIQEETRELIANLLAVNLQEININEALCQIVTRFQEQTDLVINLKFNGQSATEQDSVVDLTLLPSSITVQLLRIIQEALMNVHKHAQEANQVNLSFEAENGQVVMVIEDDGNGFDPALIQSNGRHFGLKVMRQRAEFMGGNLSIRSKPGEGTRILVHVPLAHEQ